LGRPPSENVQTSIEATAQARGGAELPQHQNSPITRIKEKPMKPVTKTLLTVAFLAATPFSAALAQSMTDAERQEMIANFLEADTNNDGALYRSEFELLMKLNAEDDLGRAAMVVRTGTYERVFTRLDKNNDGAISKEEIQEFAEERG
jgi:hypothetical protein